MISLHWFAAQQEAGTFKQQNQEQLHTKFEWAQSQILKPIGKVSKNAKAKMQLKNVSCTSFGVQWLKDGSRVFKNT